MTDKFEIDEKSQLADFPKANDELGELIFSYLYAELAGWMAGGGTPTFKASAKVWWNF